MAREILNIDTLTPDRLRINIDGREYELVDRDDLGLEEIVKLNKLSTDITRLQNLDEFTPEDARELSMHLEALCRLLILDCPEEVHARMKDRHRVALFQAFDTAVGERSPATQPPNRKQRRSIGANKSRSANASTAVAPKNGGT